MKQAIAGIISVIFALGTAYLLRPGNKLCGTLNYTGSCPSRDTWYYPVVNDTVKVLLQHKWILAAASSNAKDAPPPSKSCVTITVTDTGTHSECIFNTFNHTPHDAKRVRIMGYDEDDKLEVHSIGAIHSWPLEDEEKVSYKDYYYSKDYLHMNSAIKSTTCWNPKTMKFDPYHFIITDPYYGSGTLNTLHKAQYLLLIGVNARSPTPELHLGMLANRKTDSRDIVNAIEIVEKFKNRVNNFMIGGVSYMPPMKIRCATDYKPPSG